MGTIATQNPEHTVKLTKIAAGHYRNPKGEVRNVYSRSGAPHARSVHARWMVTFSDGRPSTVVSHLNIARTLLA